jgi:Protein of unknown function (DUF1302)
MARRGRSMWGWGWVVLIAAVLGIAVQPAAATIKYGPLQISGSVDSQNLVRNRSETDYQFIQNRNTFLLRFDWDWLQGGKLADRIDIPFIKYSHLYLLYRGVYDGFYDIAPGDNQQGLTRLDDVIGGPIVGNKIGDVNPDGSLKSGAYSRITEKGRNSLKFENTLREAYVDLKLRDLPLSLRLGRQQVIWGESDQFRLMDIWNPLDLTWHLQQEDWDKIRIPLWLIKGIWEFGQIGPLSNTFLETVWNPGDFQPGAKVAFLPQPWGVPVPDPLRAGQIQLGSPDAGPVVLSPIFHLNGTSFRRGDFKRNPEQASDFGTRFHAVTPQGVEFTANYLYIRGRGIGAVAGAPFGLDIKRIVVPDTFTPNNAIPGAKWAGLPVFPADVTAEVRHPYSHIFGVTGNYFDGDWTNAVFRLEMAYQLGAPFQTRDGRVPVFDTRGNVKQGLQAPIAFTKRDVWAGMVGFDRPTWIRWLNNKTTWFLTGQFFWSYVNGKVPGLRGGVVSAGENPYFSPKDLPFLPQNVQKTGLGQWTSGPYAGQLERTQDASPFSDYADNIRRWELLSTLAATSFYRGGTVVPFIAGAWDPVNQNFLVQAKVDWFYTNNLIIQPQLKWFTSFGQKASFDPWGAGGLNNRRDEEGIKITYQF